MVGFKGGTFPGRMCVCCKERRGDWETSYRQGKRVSNSIGLLPLAAGCLWFKKSCWFSPVFVACLSSFPQCSCFYTPSAFLMIEVTNLNLLCCAVQSPGFLSLHLLASWCSKFLWWATKIQMFYVMGVSKTEQKFWSDEGTNCMCLFCGSGFVAVTSIELLGEMPSQLSWL